MFNIVEIQFTFVEIRSDALRNTSKSRHISLNRIFFEYTRITAEGI